LSVIDEQFDRGGPAVTKHINRSFERVVLQLLTTQGGQTIDAASEIGWRHRDKNTALRTEL
jgi:hypothetical protein